MLRWPNSHVSRQSLKWLVQSRRKSGSRAALPRLRERLRQLASAAVNWLPHKTLTRHRSMLRNNTTASSSSCLCKIFENFVNFYQQWVKFCYQENSPIFFIFFTITCSQKKAYNQFFILCYCDGKSRGLVSTVENILIIQLKKLKNTFF